MRVLLTNDDGIDAPGLRALHAALLGGERGVDTIDPVPGLKPISDTPEPVFTVAPLTVQSATSHGVTFHTPLMARPADLSGHPGVAVDGRPADCVKVAVAELWPQRYGAGSRPDLVVSGMNAGANVGINVIYSGTVAAAIEAAFLGVPAIAVSLHLGRGRPLFDLAARHARRAIDRVVASGLLGPHTVVNINVPRCEAPQASTLAERTAAGLPAMPQGALPRGARNDPTETDAVEWDPITGPDAGVPHDPEAEMPIVVCPMNVHGIADRFDRRVSPAGQAYYWSAAGGFDFHATDPGTDVDLLFQRHITVTPLRFDLTNDATIGGWRDALG